MTELTKEQLRKLAMLRKKRLGISDSGGILADRDLSIRAKGTIPVNTKLTKDSRFSNDFVVEKVQGLPDTVVVRAKGKERGVLTNRENLRKILEVMRKEKNLPPHEALR